MNEGGVNLKAELFLGDCLVYLKKMPSESVDLVLTDPPYNINFSSPRKTHDSIKNDDMSWGDFEKFIMPIFKEIYRVLKHDRVAFVFTGTFEPFSKFLEYSKKAGFIVKNGLVLRENSLSLLSSPKEKVKNDVRSWINEWRAIFPKGKNSGGFIYRGSRSDCLKKMTKFIKDNPDYTKEQIIEATKVYVSRFAMKNYQYMQLANYFIHHKDRGSTLEAELENFENTEIKTQVKVYGEQEFKFPSKLD